MSLVAPKAIRPIEEETRDDDGENVTSEAFWPVINLNHLRQSMRLTGDVTSSRLKHEATEAVIYVNQSLDAWREKQQQQGYDTLEKVPSPMINDTTQAVYRYQRAVYSFTKAALIEQYRDIDTTRDGEKHALALSSQIDDLRRDGQNALRDLLGRRRMLIEIV